jgi:hypothetical protein
MATGPITHAVSLTLFWQVAPVALEQGVLAEAGAVAEPMAPVAEAEAYSGGGAGGGGGGSYYSGTLVSSSLNAGAGYVTVQKQ